MNTNNISNIYRNLNDIDFDTFEHNVYNYLKNIKKLDLGFCEHHLSKEIIALINSDEFIPDSTFISEFIKKDKYGFLMNYIIQMHPYTKEQIKEYILCNDKTVKYFGEAILIYKNHWDLLDFQNDDFYKLIKVSFSYKLLDDDILNKLDYNKTITHIKDNIINTFCLKNIINLHKSLNFEIDAGSRKIHINFFSKQEYVSNDFETYLHSYLIKYPDLLEELCYSLRIDPFTRQTDYYRWLTDAKKFYSLIKLSKKIGYEKETFKFCKKVKLFLEKYESELDYLSDYKILNSF